MGVPGGTWIGQVKSTAAVSPYCWFCRDEKIIITNVTTHSRHLCRHNRTGILCGACARNFSLKLGVYACGNCSSSTYEGILIIFGSILAGMILIIVLFSLNLTVSSGLINGLLFYCNIVHSYTINFLPVASDSSLVNSTNTMVLPNNIIRFLGTLLAWTNLDLGIVSCFFEGYNTYISTWVQFLFPLYIWVLVLIIVLASKHSRRVSKLTTSRTVPVLATLLLLSYTKLLSTCFDALSFTDLKVLKDDSSLRVWSADGNIPYLSKKHIPLAAMSCLTLAAYILPLTFLLLLGPVLQKWSNYKMLRWVNRIKPFFDAFYGPFTSRSRYWVGILLLARLILFMFAVYSLGDIYFHMLIISTLATTVLVTWIVLGQGLSIYAKTHLNYLELFFYFNLVLFSNASAYIQQDKNRGMHEKQILGIVMIGSVFIVFSGIMTYQICLALHSFKRVQNVVKKILAGFKVAHIAVEKIFARRRDSTPRKNEKSETSEEKHLSITHSNVELKECITSSCQLREPLLNDS